MEKVGPTDGHTSANEAEADAEAAKAAETAARARARAISLRAQAELAATTPPIEPEQPVYDVADGDVERPADIGEREDPGADEDEEPAGRVPPLTRAFGVRLTRVAAALVVLVTLGLLGASGYMMWHHRQVAEEQQRSAEFAAAARQGVITLMSLNFTTAQDDVKRIVDNTTGEFRKDFQSQADEFAKVAQASKVITEATVDATAVQSMTNDTATVLVAVTTQVSNSASEQQQPRSWRFRIDLARDSGQLKLAKVEFVP